MAGLAAALASLALATSTVADARGDVRWIVGPAAVELDGGRVTCVLPTGVALAPGTAARPILEALASGSDGTELAVLSPTVPTRTWFVVVTWRSPGAVDGALRQGGPVREGSLIWLERPRRDERTGRIRWSFTGPGADGPIVNDVLLLPASGGGVQLTLAAPVEQLAEARAQLARIADGLEVGEAPPAGRGPR
jgi:uncharacterized membrane-anchored protein